MKKTWAEQIEVVCIRWRCYQQLIQSIIRITIKLENNNKIGFVRITCATAYTHWAQNKILLIFAPHFKWLKSHLAGRHPFGFDFLAFVFWYSRFQYTCIGRSTAYSLYFDMAIIIGSTSNRFSCVSLLFVFNIHMHAALHTSLASPRRIRGSIETLRWCAYDSTSPTRNCRRVGICAVSKTRTRQQNRQRTFICTNELHDFCGVWCDIWYFTSNQRLLNRERERERATYIKQTCVSITQDISMFSYRKAAHKGWISLTEFNGAWTNLRAI